MPDVLSSPKESHCYLVDRAMQEDGVSLNRAADNLQGMVQAWVGHFVSSITLPKVILSYLSTYDER